MQCANVHCQKTNYHILIFFLVKNYKGTFVSVASLLSSRGNLQHDQPNLSGFEKKKRKELQHLLYSDF